MKFLTTLAVVSSLVFAPSATGVEKHHIINTTKAVPRVHHVSPMTMLPATSRQGFTCIMWVESRSTPTKLNTTDYNPSSGAGGIFQFVPYIWQYAAGQLHIRTMYAQQATVSEQFKVAAYYYDRNNGFNPEWRGDC